MTAPNLVNSDIIKGYTTTQRLSYPHARILRNPAASNNVIKVNGISVGYRETNVTPTTKINLKFKRGGVDYFLFKNMVIDDHPSEGSDFSVLESTIYLEEGDELWAWGESNNNTSYTVVVSIAFEVITDQITLTFDVPPYVEATASIEWEEADLGWTYRTSGTSNTLWGVAYGNSTFVIVGQGGTILTSSDGITWTSRSGTSSHLYGVSYTNSTFMAVGESGTILTSSDGITWTLRTSGTSSLLRGVIYGNSTFVAVGDLGTILTSSDGTSWTSRTSGTSSNLRGITYGNSTFVTVGDSGIIFTSSDGITWTSRTSGTYYNLYGVSYTNSTFVAVGNGGIIFTSSDGITWTSRTSGTSNSLRGITYGNSTFMAVGDSGTILTSSDEITWTSQTSGTYNIFLEVIYANSTFVLVGSSGTIYTSSGINIMHFTAEPNTTYGYTISQGDAGAISPSDFVQPSVASLPYTGSFITDSNGEGHIPFQFTADTSTGEGDEMIDIVTTDGNIEFPNVIVKDTSIGVVDIYVQGMQSRYGGNIGEIRWYILNANHTINTTLTNFSNGTYNSSSGGYTNSGYRNSWTDTGLNYKNQTVQVNPGNTYYLAIKHRRWSSYNGDYAVDGITINVNPGGPQNYYSLESNNMSGWLISWSPGSTPVESQGWVSSTTNYQEGWVIRSGSTPSYSTGPSSAGDGSYYVYTETSYNNNSDRVYYLKSPPIYA